MGMRSRGAARVLSRLAGTTSFVEPEAAHLRRFVAPGDVAIDIGAEYGLYTVMLADLVGRDGRVEAFEPQPGPLQFVRTVTRALGLQSSTTVHHGALGNRTGTATLSLPRRGGLPVHGRAFITDGSSGLGPNEEFTAHREREIRLTTLDRAVEVLGLPSLSFVKIDVEGFEPAVVEGGAASIRRLRPTLMIEIEDRHLAKFGTRGQDLADELLRLGYSMLTLRDGDWREVRTITDETRNYLFAA